MQPGPVGVDDEQVPDRLATEMRLSTKAIQCPSGGQAGAVADEVAFGPCHTMLVRPVAVRDRGRRTNYRV